MKCISYDPTYLLKAVIRTQTLMLLLENDPANLNFMVFCKEYHKWNNKFTYSLKTVYEFLVYGTGTKNVNFITTSPVLMITIHQFYVPASYRKEMYSDEIELATGGV